MTTYAFRIVLNDSEVMTVETALKHYRKICEAELAAGPKSPYWADLRDIDAVLDRLFADTEMMSTYSGLWPKDAG